MLIGHQRPKELSSFVQQWAAKIAALDVRDALLVPGGWTSLTGQNSLMHIILRAGMHVCALSDGGLRACSFIFTFITVTYDII